MARDAKIAFRRIGPVLEWTAGNNKLAFDTTRATAEIAEAAMFHGFKQKIDDARALSRDPETGKSATLDEKFSAMATVIQNLYDGNWNSRRESVNRAIFVEAVAEVRKVSIESVEKALEKWTDAEVRAIQRRTDVSEAMLRIRAEKFPDDPAETDALFDAIE